MDYFVPKPMTYTWLAYTKTSWQYANGMAHVKHNVFGIDTIFLCGLLALWTIFLVAQCSASAKTKNKLYSGDPFNKMELKLGHG